MIPKNKRRKTAVGNTRAPRDQLCRRATQRTSNDTETAIKASVRGQFSKLQRLPNFKLRGTLPAKKSPNWARDATKLRTSYVIIRDLARKWQFFKNIFHTAIKV